MCATAVRAWAGAPAVPAGSTAVALAGLAS